MDFPSLQSPTSLPKKLAPITSSRGRSIAVATTRQTTKVSRQNVPAKISKFSVNYLPFISLLQTPHRYSPPSFSAPGSSSNRTNDQGPTCPGTSYRSSPPIEQKHGGCLYLQEPLYMNPRTRTSIYEAPDQFPVSFHPVSPPLTLTSSPEPPNQEGQIR